MNKKIKIAQKEQIPFMLIVGEREMEEGTVALRRRGTREQVTMGFDEFLALAERLVQSRSMELE
jgi:threonyl-tRNA synthetase